MEGGYRHKNPRFDEYSNMILNLKNRSPWAIRYFYRVLEPLSNKDTVLVVVPSHDPDKRESGILDLAKLMCRKGLWIDGTDCLQRIVKVPKLSTGGNRSFMAQKKSMNVIKSDVIQGRDIFLLDDVTTTGNTLIACRLLLENKGANSVREFALGATFLYKNNSLH